MGDSCCKALVVLVLAGACAPGCMQDMVDDDGLPGQSMGTYRVRATLTSNACGPGAFGALDDWEFEVKLAREGSVIYWNNGTELVEGSLADDGKTFSFSDQLRMRVSERKGAQAGCTMFRQDTASGELDSAEVDKVTGFTGSLTYGYDQEKGSDCAAVVAQAGAAQLPCKLDYAIAATRE